MSLVLSRHGKNRKELLAADHHALVNYNCIVEIPKSFRRMLDFIQATLAHPVVDSVI